MRSDRDKKKKRTEKDIQTNLGGPETEKIEQCHTSVEERAKKEVLRENERGQRERVQVMVLSCWCHRQI